MNSFVSFVLLALVAGSSAALLSDKDFPVPSHAHVHAHVPADAPCKESSSLKISDEAIATEEEKASEFLAAYEKEYFPLCLEFTDANWDYASNITDENGKRQLDANQRNIKFQGEKGKQTRKFHWKMFKDAELRRIFKGFANIGLAALPEERAKERLEVEQSMESNHAKAKVCPYTKPDQPKPKSEECNLSLEPEIKNILEKSKDYDELLHVWKEFREKAGKPMKEKWLKFAEISNEASRANGLKDYAEDLLDPYVDDSPSFEQDIAELWKELKPLYQQVHAFVRSRLISQFPGKIKDDGPIPAHLLGHIHAQHASRDGLEPYPGRPNLDVTDAMVKKGMKPLDIFRLSDEYFTSLGLKPMTEDFWKYSILEKPTDGREIVCHASAWDRCGTNRTRIKQCTRVKMSELIVAHHEMGHIEYYLQYQHQPSYYQSGANPGFHEAVGDTLALAVSTPKHLQAIGLLDKAEMKHEDTINYLMRIALDKVFILPSSYFYDVFRWNVYRGNYATDKLNDKWWQLHLEHAGLCPAVRRTNDDFDPASKYHVSSGTPYIRYFVANILQFQFYEALCDASGHKGPLHECDFYKSKESGKLMGGMLRMGSSKPWPEALKAITGGTSAKMDARPLVRYFQPLLEWLTKFNMNKTIGWTSADPNLCPGLTK